MKKMQIIMAVLALTVVSAGVVFAKAEKLVATVTPPGQGSPQVTVNIPGKAQEVTDGVFSLGERVDPESGETVQGYMIVDRRDGHAKPDGVGNGKPPKDNTGESSCFAYIADGAGWLTVEPYRVHDINPEGLDPFYVSSVVERQVAQWEDANDGAIDGNIGLNVFGTQEIYNGVVDLSVLDGKNDVTFGVITDPGVIGVTTVWGIFRGNPNNRKLVEWDQVYNTDFEWSEATESGTMNFENIAAHEIGHAFGMGHPDNSCAEETMFWSAGYTEIKKIDLFDGDIAGIDGLY